jgi:prolyl oligopeptidase
VTAQNAVTSAYLDRIPFRAQLKARLQELYDYPRYFQPSARGSRIFFYANDGLQNQNVLFVQVGLDGPAEVLIDPNTWSSDGTVRLVEFRPSRDARYAVYGVSKSGSDWIEYKVIDLSTKRTLSDTIQWVKVSNAAWRGSGFYYSRYPAPPPGKELSSSNEHHRVFYHRLGTAQAEDELVFEDPAGPQRFHLVETTEDERFEVLYVYDRAAGKKGNAVFLRDGSGGSARFLPLVPVVSDHTFHVIGNDGGYLLVHTDKGAPNGRIFRVDSDDPDETRWTTVVAESTEPIERASTGGGRLFVTRMKDVTARVSVHGLDGTFDEEVVLPGAGTVEGFSGERGAPGVFYTFTSFTAPSTLYRYDIAERSSVVFRASDVPGFDASAFETNQVFIESRDGTRVPMFLVHRKGLVRDGTNPVLMYGYGGFNVSTTPNFNALRLALLERGFIYASVNMRGGSEYGEAWHDAGTKARKQNVFDDFIAAAEWMVAQKYSTSGRMAMIGASNGGLLVGAVMNQRPDLFGVAVPQVGVMDMLRFHKFTIGWNWAPDYGSSDNPEEFAALYAYSPLHNIRAGKTYPATLIVTADHDDRVVPAHSFKYAATLQAHASGERPALIRIETRSGHGASNTAKLIEVTADIYAFVLQNLGKN